MRVKDYDAARVYQKLRASERHIAKLKAELELAEKRRDWLAGHLHLLRVAAGRER